jgi:DNA-binding transcriptional LysR family regulator
MQSAPRVCYVMGMSLDQIRTFVTVVEEGSLRSAAARLHLTEPPLSRHITRLEDELGARLFERHARGMTLRPEGLRFLVHAREVLEAVARAHAFLDDDDSGSEERRRRSESDHTLSR